MGGAFVPKRGGGRARDERVMTAGVMQGFKNV